MTEKIHIEQLKTLMETLPPGEVRARYWATMDEESRSLFAEFENVCADLDTLPRELATLLPPVPEEPARGTVVPMRRRTLHTWAFPLVAAAAFFIGFAVPRSVPEEVTIPLDPTLDTVRGSDTPADPSDYDRQIADAFFERGQHFLAEERYEDAYSDFRRARELNPFDEQSLEYLIVVTDILGLDEEKRRYEQELQFRDL